MRWVALLAVSIVFLTGCSGRDQDVSADDSKLLSKDEIIRVAQKTALALSLPLHKIEIRYDDGNDRWLHYLAQFRRQDEAECKVLERRLRNRKYQAVFLDGELNLLDGHFWVLVDQRTGEVIMAVQYALEEDSDLV